MGGRGANDTLRLVAIFVGTTVAGLALILFAVATASRELVSVKEIDLLNEVLRERLAAALSRGERAAEEPAARLAARLSTDAFPVFAIVGEDGPPLRIPRVDATLDQRTLNASRINARGGYLKTGEGILSWTSRDIPATKARLVMVHLHRPLGWGPLLGIYQSRLFVPAAFYVWMMVWISFVLTHMISRLRTQREEIEHMAWYDNLTGLPNRNLFFRKLEEVAAEADSAPRPFSLAVIDLDGFKQVNDTFGHDAGDQLLRLVGQRFRNALRGDDLVARSGGDEFVLLCRDGNPETAEAVCERIADTLRGEYVLPQGTARIGASVGLAHFPGDAASPTELLRQADQAMYAAKRSGGGLAACAHTLPQRWSG